MPQEKYVSLSEYLKNAKHKGFDHKPHYYTVGDYLTYFVTEDRCFSERIDDTLTIYKHHETGELVGVEICGLAKSGILNEQPDREVSR